MGEQTGISWCHSTFNPWIGCSKVSDGCTNCYAERDSSRFWPEQRLWGLTRDGATRRTFGPKHWAEPLKWNKKAAALGERHRVFCASMADVFDKDAPEGERERLWELIDRTPSLDWLLLTKRVGNVDRMCGTLGWPKNAWLGISVVNQPEADRDIPKLLRLKLDLGILVVFLSCEPLLGPIDFNALADGSENLNALTGLREDPFGDVVTRRVGSKLDWVITGGESGPGARPCDLQSVADIVKQCRAAKTPCFVKQLGASYLLDGELLRPMFDRKGGDLDDFPRVLRVREFPRAGL